MSGANATNRSGRQHLHAPVGKANDKEVDAQDAHISRSLGQSRKGDVGALLVSTKKGRDSSARPTLLVMTRLDESSVGWAK